MATNPFELDELLGAYALDAVDDDERRAIEDYLLASPRAAAEVQQHRDVATMLAWSGMDAPEGLWERIAGSLDGDEAAPAAQLGDVIPIAAGRDRRRPNRNLGSWTLATAAAALIAFVAVRASNDDAPATAGIDAEARTLLADPTLAHAQLSAASNSSLKVLAVVDGHGRGYLLADSLPVLPADRTYQLWGRIGGRLISLGVLGADPNTSVFTVQDDVDLLAITEEAHGGVNSSSHPPVVEGALT